MASPCLLVLDAPDARSLASTEAEEAAQAAMAEVQRIEAGFSRYRADSIVSRINAGAGLPGWIEVDAETAGLLDFADRLYGLSEGLFDITSGVLRQAWDFRKPERPDARRVEELQQRVGWGRVQWDAQARRIRLPEPGMELDFGGFGKEYAADRAASVLMAHGYGRGYVNLGGDLRVLGPQAGERPWRLAIQHPRDPQGRLATLELDQGALATSGDYERFFEIDGRRYCHILDPRTGWPVAHWRSVSVVAPVCTAAGALATIAMLMGADGLDWVRGQGVRCLLNGPDGRLFDEVDEVDEVA